MRIKGTIVERMYFVVETEVPDDATPSQQAKALWDTHFKRSLESLVDPDETDTDGCIYNMEIVNH